MRRFCPDCGELREFDYKTQPQPNVTHVIVYQECGHEEEVIVIPKPNPPLGTQ